MSKIWADTKEKRKQEPCRPHQEFFDYINERHRIYLKRRAGKPWPWTDDLTLRDWSFTNVWRQLDRTSVVLTDNIFRPHYNDSDQATLLFNIILHREFNWIPTSDWLGYVKKWNPAKILAGINDRKNEGCQIFTNAHLVRSADWRPKTDSVIDILTPIWEDRKRLLKVAKTEGSVEKMFWELHKFEYIGDFMSYQFVLDMIESPILSDAYDKHTWAATGPGALKGLKWLYPVATMKTSLDQMRELHAEGMAGALEKHVRKFLLPFTVHEIEFCLCEFGKLMKVRLGYGQPRNRYKPKGS